MTNAELLAKQKELLAELRRKKVADKVVEALSADITRIMQNLKEDPKIDTVIKTTENINSQLANMPSLITDSIPILIDESLKKKVIEFVDKTISKIELPKDGYTPVKGKDYFTDKEIKSITDQIVNSIKIPEPKIIKEITEQYIEKDITDEQKEQIIKEAIARFEFTPPEIIIPEIKAEDIRDKLESLKGNKRLDARAIKNLPELTQQVVQSGSPNVINSATKAYVDNRLETIEITEVSESTYTLTKADQLLHVTRTSTGICTITLPSELSLLKKRVIIKDAGGNASTNNITIETEGAQTIDGAGSLVLSTNYVTVTLYCDGTNWFTTTIDNLGASIGYVNHGATASTARPTGYASIQWVGSVEPTNMANGDTWIDTA